MEHAPENDLRFEGRNNLFVMAALYAVGHPVIPVRVRNLSRTGALIEAGGLPLAGSEVRLSRAHLSASGTIMWVEGTKAGLKFDDMVAVADWLPKRQRSLRQETADEIIPEKQLSSSNFPARGEKAGGPSIADELLRLKLLLARAAETLALDGAIAQRHLSSLQAIDSVRQSLEQIATSTELQQLDAHSSDKASPRRRSKRLRP